MNKLLFIILISFIYTISSHDIYDNSWALIIGIDKYDNVRIGLNSRLDTLQAVVLLNKLNIFDQEIILRNEIADYYSKKLSNYLTVPFIENSHKSVWAQYSLLAKSEKERNN